MSAWLKKQMPVRRSAPRRPSVEAGELLSDKQSSKAISLMFESHKKSPPHPDILNKYNKKTRDIILAEFQANSKTRRNLKIKGQQQNHFQANFSLFIWAIISMASFILFSVSPWFSFPTPYPVVFAIVFVISIGPILTSRLKGIGKEVLTVIRLLRKRRP